MRRREFISLVGAAAVAGPLAARAQQPRMRRVGVLMNFPADDPEGQARLSAFVQGLRQLGWTDGRNVRIEVPLGCGRRRSQPQIRGGIGRAGAGRHPGLRQCELGGVAADYAQRADRVCGRHRSGWRRASSRACRGRAATPPDFSLFEYSLSGKWLELLKEIAPDLRRIAVLSRSRSGRRDRPVRGDPGHGAAVIWRGADSDRRARRRRDRTRNHGFRGCANGGLIVTASPSGGDSSQSDHLARGRGTVCPQSIPSATIPRVAA